jgi:hypothetical protein
MSIWKSKTKLENKPWGQVEIIPSPFGVNGKIIKLNSDHRTSLKYYTHLNQVLYCLSGKVVVFAPNEKEFGDFSQGGANYFELIPGDSINIQALNPYRLTAYENSVLVEVLIGHVQNGSVMLEDDYGRLENKTTGDNND